MLAIGKQVCLLAAVHRSQHDMLVKGCCVYRAAVNPRVLAFCPRVRNRTHAHGFLHSWLLYCRKDRRVSDPGPKSSPRTCTPTTGVERWVLHGSKVRNAVVTEVGGAVIGLWSRYLNPNISAVLFFIDIDDKATIPEAAVELYTFLTCASLETIRPTHNGV
jgi:hypothetical protein